MKNEKILTFVEERPTATGCPRVVVCRITNDDDYAAARKLEDRILHACNGWDDLQKQRDDLEATLENLIFYVSNDGVPWSQTKEAIVEARQVIAAKGGE